MTNTSTAKPRLLLIEDDVLVGEFAVETLADLGYEVEHFIGVKTGPAANLIGFRQDWTEEEIDLGKFRIAFVDGQLPGRSLQGPQIIPVLVKANIVSICTSSDWNVASSMRQAGAQYSLNKTQFRKGALIALAEIESALN